MAACPSCGAALKNGVAVCSTCFHVLDREAWTQHDAGRLGADGRGGGHELEDPPVGPVPLTVGGLEAGSGGSAARLWISGKLLRWGRRR